MGLFENGVYPPAMALFMMGNRPMDLPSTVPNIFKQAHMEVS